MGGMTTGLFSAAGGGGSDAFAHLTPWPPASSGPGWLKPAATSSPVQFGSSQARAVKVTTVPFAQLVPEPGRGSQSETEADEDGEHYFSDLAEEDEEPEGVLQVTPQLASGGTTPKKPEIQPARKIFFWKAFLMMELPTQHATPLTGSRFAPIKSLAYGGRPCIGPVPFGNMIYQVHLNI